MTDLEKIRTGIKTIAGNGDSGNDAQVYIATVNEGSVDVPARTCACTLLSGDTDISLDTVNLMASVNDGILYVPADGSAVVIISSPTITPYIALFSDLVSIFLVAGGSTFKIYGSGLELNGANFDGLLKIVPSVKAWNDTQNDINNLKSDINSILSLATALQTGLTALSGSSAPVVGSALSGLFLPYITGVISNLTPYAGQDLVVTDQSNVENTTVKQGDGS